MTIPTVTGEIEARSVRLADAHAHAWIDPPAGVAEEYALRLNDPQNIHAELADFRRAGGDFLLDCQPGGCGRDVDQLIRAARASGVHIACSTGFHLRRYYPPGHVTWSGDASAVCDRFVHELRHGVADPLPSAPGRAVRAAAIKVAHPGRLEGKTEELFAAAAHAAADTGTMVTVHTERGENVEEIPPFFARHRVPARQLYLCHVDKRPDPELHRELSRGGALLGYDTFVRPKYVPERNVWPLLERMVGEGLGHGIAVGQDLADPGMWRSFGGSPGMRHLPDRILPELRRRGFDEETVRHLTGENIARRLDRDARRQKDSDGTETGG